MKILPAVSQRLSKFPLFHRFPSKRQHFWIFLLFLEGIASAIYFQSGRQRWAGALENTAALMLFIQVGYNAYVAWRTKTWPSNNRWVFISIVLGIYLVAMNAIVN